MFSYSQSAFFVAASLAVSMFSVAVVESIVADSRAASW